MFYSAGVIPFRKRNDGRLEYLLGHPGGNHWNQRNLWMFMKGGVEGEETYQETALREFKEETGLELPGITCDDLISLGRVQQNPKKVAIAFALYYPGIDETKCHSNFADDGVTLEIDGYRWFTFDELKEVTHKAHVNFYQQIEDMVNSASEDDEDY